MMCYSFADYLNDKIRIAKLQSSTLLYFLINCVVLEKKGLTIPEVNEPRPGTPVPDDADALIIANQQKALHLQYAYLIPAAFIIYL